MIEEVIEGLSIERDAQRPHGREIALRVFARRWICGNITSRSGPWVVRVTPDPALQRVKYLVESWPCMDYSHTL